MTLKEQFRAIIMVIAAMMLYCTSATAATSGNCGNYLTWSYNSTDGVLTIRGTGKMRNYYYVDNPNTSAPWKNLNFNKVVIEQGVTSIGDAAFAGCSKLTSINMPNSVTSIGSSAFCDCSGLTSISLPNGVTSIGGEAFRNCSGLTSISLPCSVTSIGEGAFSGCSGLTSISIPDGVTSIGYSAFSGCSGLTSISIPDGVTSIGAWAFGGCSGLTSINIPDGVTSIGSSAFRGCSGLTSISIPSSVTSIDGLAFSGCSELSIIKVDKRNSKYDSRSDCNAIINTAKNALEVGCKNSYIPSSVTSIGAWAFRDCSGLTSISIPRSVTSIGYSAFWGCSGLTSISIPSGVTSIGSAAFMGCSGLKLITVLAEIPPECESDNIFNDVDKQTCELVVPRETVGLYKLRSPWKYFYKITAGINAAKADRVSVAAVGGEIAITGADCDAVVEVYGLNGMLIYRGKDKSVPVPSAGVYVVRVAGKTVKATVN